MKARPARRKRARQSDQPYECRQHNLKQNTIPLGLFRRLSAGERGHQVQGGFRPPTSSVTADFCNKICHNRSSVSRARVALGGEINAA